MYIRRSCKGSKSLNTTRNSPLSLKKQRCCVRSDTVCVRVLVYACVLEYVMYFLKKTEMLCQVRHSVCTCIFICVCTYVCTICLYTFIYKRRNCVLIRRWEYKHICVPTQYVCMHLSISIFIRTFRTNLAVHTRISHTQEWIEILFCLHSHGKMNSPVWTWNDEYTVVHVSLCNMYAQSRSRNCYFKHMYLIT